MPRKPDIPSKHQGCIKLIPSGTKYCEEHQVLYHVEIKPLRKKVTTIRGEKLGQGFEAASSLCEMTGKGNP